MTFEEQVKAIDPNIAGIYLITNVVNGKHYVGQSIYLRKRLMHHISNYNRERYDAPLYRAFTKHGIDNFTVDILWSTNSKEFNAIKSTLDKLEKQYIEEYHSYGEYNQTLGGDAGVLGYKFTEEQKTAIKHHSEAEWNKKFSESKQYWVYAKNLITGETHIAIAPRYLSDLIGVCTATIKNACKPDYLVCFGKYAIARTKEELEEKLNKIKENDTQNYCSKYGSIKLLNEYKKFLDNLNGEYTEVELARMQNVSKDAISKRNRKLRDLGYEIKCIKSHNKIKHWVVINNITNENWVFQTAEDAAKKVGCSIKHVKRLIYSGKSNKNGYSFKVIYK